MAAGSVSTFAKLIKLDEQVVNRLGQVVDLVLKFLDIPVRLVILARLRLVILVELLVEVGLRLLDLLVNLLDDFVHVLSFAHLAENVALELEHGLLDDPVVEVDHVGADLYTELRVLVHDGLEGLLAKTVGIQMSQSLVKELRLSAEQVFVTADDGLLAQLDVEVLRLLVNAEADAVLAC